MPLRGLFYFAQQYEGLLGVEDADVYGKKRLSLPTPEYIIFYNGKDIAEDRRTLYLSDSFSVQRIVQIEQIFLILKQTAE